MTAPKTDRRILRTRALLRQALAQQGTGTQDAAVGFGCRQRGKVLS